MADFLDTFQNIRPVWWCWLVDAMSCWGLNHHTSQHYTWWLIPLSKWVITPVINRISRVNPLITGVITHLLSGMSHQVPPLSTFHILGIIMIHSGDDQIKPPPMAWLEKHWTCWQLKTWAFGIWSYSKWYKYPCWIIPPKIHSCVWNLYGCVWKCCVPHCTQWFCWSLSLWKMASYHWEYTQYFQTNPNT